MFTIFTNAGPMGRVVFAFMANSLLLSLIALNHYPAQAASLSPDGALSRQVDQLDAQYHGVQDEAPPFTYEMPVDSGAQQPTTGAGDIAECIPPDKPTGARDIDCLMLKPELRDLILANTEIRFPLDANGQIKVLHSGETMALVIIAGQSVRNAIQSYLEGYGITNMNPIHMRARVTPQLLKLLPAKEPPIVLDILWNLEQYENRWMFETDLENYDITHQNMVSMALEFTFYLRPLGESHPELAKDYETRSAWSSKVPIEFSLWNAGQYFIRHHWDKFI